MKKIISGIIGSLVIVALIGGVAFALFSSTVTISGLTLTTADTALEIRPDVDEAPWTTNLDMSSITFKKLIPGTYEWGRFYLLNTSTGTPEEGEAVRRAIDFDISAKITEPAQGDWNLLKDVIYAEIYVENNHGYTTGRHTLEEWRNGVEIADHILIQGDNEVYIVEFWMDETVDNTYKGKSITGINIEITGTQHQYVTTTE
ncbi:hypothetical protein K0B04_00950 [Patescibacteria group bacterium]|nr:hypothetical protein [Patescibacteria group bacterium]